MFRRVIGVVAAFLFVAGVVMYFDEPEPFVPMEAAPTTTVATVALADAVPSARSKIADWKTTPLFMPKALPDGWVLRAADLLTATATVEGCEQVELNYEDPDDETVGFLYLYEFPKACAKPLTGTVRPFTAGPHTGVARFADGGIVAQITVGTTTLQADTDLKFAELATVLSELVPLDVATLP